MVTYSGQVLQTILNFLDMLGIDMGRNNPIVQYKQPSNEHQSPTEMTCKQTKQCHLIMYKVF